MKPLKRISCKSDLVHGVNDLVVHGAPQPSSGVLLQPPSTRLLKSREKLTNTESAKRSCHMLSASTVATVGAQTLQKAGQSHTFDCSS